MTDSQSQLPPEESETGCCNDPGCGRDGYSCGRKPKLQHRTAPVEQNESGLVPPKGTHGYRCTCGHISWWSSRENADYAARLHVEEWANG